MRRTSGQLALMAAMGGGFKVVSPYETWTYSGEDQSNGTYLTQTRNDDGRSIAITSRAGDGWQLGTLVHAVATGPWRVPADALTVTTWRGVRALLAQHEPGREEPYCGGEAMRQPRALDGRERDILVRILNHIRWACTDRDAQAQLLRVIPLERDEAFRLVEIAAVLDARDD